MRHHLQAVASLLRFREAATKWSSFGVFLCLALAALVVGLVMLNHARDTVLTGEVWETGMEFAGYIDNEYPNLSHLLSPDADEAEVEAELGRIASLGNIFQFEFRDRSGNLVFSTGSYHAEQGSVEHHAHTHAPASDEVPHFDQNVSTSADASSVTVHAPVPVAGVGGNAQVHEVIFHHGDGTTLPRYYAEIVHPVTDGAGVFAGEIVLLMDVTERTNKIDAALVLTSGGLVALFAVVAAAPLGYYVYSIRREKEADAKIRYLAKHDPLTGALNRRSFLEALNDRLMSSTIQSGVALHFIDLDHFKQLNDTFGHEMGDAVLQTIVRRVTAVAGDRASCARLGGDEIAVVQWNVTSDEEIDAMAKAIVEVTSSPVFNAGHTVTAFASVGTAVAPQDGSDSARLLRCADLALYQAKRLGRSRAIRFTASMEAEFEARRKMEKRLRWALHNEGFEIHYQPLLGANNLEVIAVEALLRMRSEDGSLIPPLDFIPMAEELGVIEEVGSWVLRRACEFAASLPIETAVAVNLSPGQFVSGNLLGVVKQALDESGLQPGLLELEITESLFLGDYGSSLEQLKAIKAMGVRIAMDDFGTGYSSLAYIWQFPFDKLKVDKSFLDRFTVRSEDVLHIIQSVVKLGHAMNMTIAAEGVENEKQYEMLKDIQCDQVQGYLISRPLPAQEITEWLQGHAQDDLRRKLLTPLVVVQDFATGLGR